MPRSIITLTTDFGLSDHFTGVMKGVILGIHPAAELVDITHLINPFRIPEAGFVIAEAYRFFPEKTVHVVVVDPGVGTARRPVLAEAAGQFFLAPDNGVLSMVLAREEHRVRSVTAGEYFLKPVSHTFHGRDIFAPVAAHLAKGVEPASFGEAISDYMLLDYHKPVHTDRHTWTGIILKVDQFGNLITNFHVAEFPIVETRAFEMRAGSAATSRFASTFGEAGFGELFVMVGSSGYLELAANQSSAAEITGSSAGAPVELTLR